MCSSDLALLVLTTDGRRLARWTIHHDRPSVREESFFAPAATSWWTRDATSIVSVSKSVAVWRGLERPSSDALDRARAKLPLRVVNGQLEVVRTGRLRGHAVRASKNIAAGTAQLEIRTPPEVGVGGLEWRGFQARAITVQATTDDDGMFDIAKLAPGTYKVTIAPADGAAWSKDVYVEADRPTEVDVQAP